MTTRSDVFLTCLAPDTVMPPANGSAARTVGLAAAVRPYLAGVAIHSFSVTPQPSHGPGRLEIIHLPLPAGGAARARYLASALLGPALGFKFPSRIDDERASILEFANEADLRAYLDHPAHVDLGRLLFTAADAVLAYDFEETPLSQL